MQWIGYLSIGIALSILSGCNKDSGTTATPLERAKQGKMLWEEKCKSVAGVRIYRSVKDVEVVVLLKIRPKIVGGEWADPNWLGAAFADEAREDSYITSFLGYEEALGPDGQPREITPARRGYISTLYKPGPKAYPGYRYVEVPDRDTGRYLRYTLVPKKKEGSKIDWIDMALEQSVKNNAEAKYAVTYEDDVNGPERALGVASSTVRVVEIATGQVLGELRRFAWSVPASKSNPNPWLTAQKCPAEAVGAHESTRKFVDQILIPSRGK